MVDYAVHRCELFEHTPTSIQCMSSYEPPAGTKETAKILAVGRENGAIELFKYVRTGFFNYLTIPGSIERNLEDLLFCDGRLFSAELRGVISEYDLTRGTTKYSEDSYGGAVWCLSAGNGNSKIAAGCEDGTLKIFSCADDRISFDKSMDRQDGRIISCSFHPDNQILVSGSVDVIRIWSYQSGHAIQRIQLDCSKNSDNIVWAVKMLKDHTVVSGDSTGKVCFWNGKNATQIQSFQTHQADVLSLCVSRDESVIYTAGVDPRVIAVHRVTAQEVAPSTLQPVGMDHSPEAVATWVRGATMQTHTHDVRAMAVIGTYLVSGGVDTNILLYNTKDSVRKKLKKISPFPHKSIVHLAQNSEMILMQYPKHLDIWKLGIPCTTSSTTGEVIKLKQEPIKLFQVKSSLSDPSNISCSAVSPCGHWLAYGTCTVFKLLWMTWKDEDFAGLSVSKVPAPWVKSPTAISFCPESKHVCVSSFGGKVYVMKLDKSGHVHLEHVIKDEEGIEAYLVTQLTANSKYIATMDLECRIRIYNLSNPTLKCTLPKRDFFPTAFSFKPSTNNLFIAYQNHSVIEFDADLETYTDWCKKAVSINFNLIEYPNRFATSRRKRQLCWNTSPITNISFSDSEANKVFFASHKNVFSMDLSSEFLEMPHSADEPSKNGGKISKRDRKIMECPVKKFDCFQHLMFFSIIGHGSSILAVERPWRDIFEQLPPTLYQKKYGT